ncbi:MAG TPA: hypothetical protein VJT75_07475 [Thermoleophilaceae bacterium]|nr:hypothetical protein [Thermoleophilaceae bacterium]
MRRIAICAAALASSALLMLPAASGAFKFGAKLDRDPDNSAPPHDCSKDGGEIASPCTRVLVASDTGLVDNHLTSPKTGKLTKIRVRAGAAGSVRFKLIRLKDPNPTTHTIKGKAVAKSKVFQVQGNGFNATNAIESFAVNMTVHKGDYLGFDSSKTSVLRCSSGGTRQFLFNPPLAVGDPFQTTTSAGSCTLMVQAIGHT